jgi:hypothetical protein
MSYMDIIYYIYNTHKKKSLRFLLVSLYYYYYDNYSRNIL